MTLGVVVYLFMFIVSLKLATLVVTKGGRTKVSHLPLDTFLVCVLISMLWPLAWSFTSVMILVIAVKSITYKR